MVLNRFTVVLDANVLFGALQRNVVLSLAEAGFFRPRWSHEIIEEFQTALEPRIGVDPAAKAVSATTRAFPEAMIECDLTLPESFGLIDAGDEHVLAAAISVRAAQIVTDNIKHFPAETLAKFDIEAVTTDAFVCNTIALDQIAAVRALRVMRERFTKPSLDGSELLSLMEKRGLVETASELADYIELI